MDEATLRQLLDDVRSGDLAPDDAVARLRRLPFADLGFARVDHHRALRQGLPEAVYGPGKTPEHCAAIVAELLREPGGPVLLTRASDAQAEAALEHNPGGTRTGTTVAWRPSLPRPGDVVVVIAGMEGALASLVGGVTAAPVVAVPTSVGYGAGLEGVTALLAMLASCAAGITVVGIDNGYGAACAVLRMLPG